MREVRLYDICKSTGEEIKEAPLPIEPLTGSDRIGYVLPDPLKCVERLRKCRFFKKQNTELLKRSNYGD